VSKDGKREKDKIKNWQTYKTASAHGILLV
jgi:hypothetical protein